FLNSLVSLPVSRYWQMILILSGYTSSFQLLAWLSGGLSSRVPTGELKKSFSLCLWVSLHIYRPLLLLTLHGARLDDRLFFPISIQAAVIYSRPLLLLGRL